MVGNPVPEYGKTSTEQYLSVELYQKITNFLISLPNLHDSIAQQAFVASAGIEPTLFDHVTFGLPTAQFVPLLILTLSRSGTFTNVTAVLQAAKQYVGQERKQMCDELIQALRDSSAATQLVTVNPIRHNLPQPDYGYFVGRESELAQIQELLSPQNRHFVITIDGIGGVGKSTLALEVADRYRRKVPSFADNEYFEVIVWITAKQTVLTGEGIIPRSRALQTLEEIYTTVAIILHRDGILHASIEEQEALIRQALTQQRTLIILDNFETIDDDRVLAFIRELPAPTKILITTRHRLDTAYPVRLVGMPEDDALQLIHNTAKQKGVPLTSEESLLLYQRTGGVPLALEWSVAQMAFGYNIQSILTQLEHPTGDIARFCFDAAFSRICKTSAESLLFALSVVATDASRDALGHVTNLQDVERDTGLVTLEKLSLITKISGRFTLLPLTKTFMVARLKGDPDLENSLRLAYIQYFQALCRKFGGEHRHLYQNLDADISNIQLAIEWAYQEEMWPEVAALTDNIVGFLGQRSRWQEVAEYAGIAVEAGKKLRDKHLIARHKIFGLGWVKFSHLHSATEGLQSIREGKQIAYDLGDQREYAKALYDESGVLCVAFDQYDAAHKMVQESLDIWQDLADDYWSALCVLSMGEIERFRGELTHALEYAKKALSMAQQHELTEIIGHSYMTLGEIYWRQAKFLEVYTISQKAISAFESLKMRHRIASACFLMAKSGYALGNIQEAIQAAQRAYDIYVQVRRHDRLAEINKLLDSITHFPQAPAEYIAASETKTTESNNENREESDSYESEQGD